MQATIVSAPPRPRIMPFSRMGDEALAARAVAGNQDAFAALCERYHGPLLGYCRSILLNTEDAHDATQSALENALRALPRREPGRPLKPWLYRIAHNEAINIVRRRQPVADGGLDADSLLTVPGPEFDSEQRTRLAQLVDDLRMLPERQRGALVMRELSGLSYDEIGLALGVSNEAARRAVFDARTSLHDAVQGRATECTSVRRTLSDGDRRRLRARGVRAHLRCCDDCRSFERAMGVRQTDLHALGPWLGGGTGLLGLLGLGGGSAKAAFVATSSATVSSGGGGLGWAGLPVAVKGMAVAAVVATTGTAAVEIPKVARHDARPAPSNVARAGAAVTPVAISPNINVVREQALAQAAAARRARRARARAAAARRSSPARVQTSAGSASRATISPPAATAPAASAPATQPVTAPPPAPAPATSTTAPKTQEQIAADQLQRIREKILAAYKDAQSIAGTGTQGALQTANSLIQSTLSQVQPMLQKILATFGLTWPTSSGTTTTAPAPSTTTSTTSLSNILAPAQNLLSGMNSLLQNLFP